ncbi:hypothetical protein HHL24_27175 [Paraburkholderia sp. RP-4-7]|jgi:hypothetical protein|uniref:HEPN domain-containing protein n=1 Tax=Paraburkholderia polaris TaxID=2728848 RepID=A0A848IGT9_9BURK|nr:hypothetical protein [Paraburkholderia polaris]NMM01608.1 hypothetical protein [Paraburkholderia polaris]
MSDLPKITGSIAVTVADFTFRPPSDGESFVLTARQLWYGAHVLAERRVETALPGALLAAQALEGGLKALLWTTGWAASELSKKPFGHDLNALWEAAANVGVMSNSPPDWCECLNALHAPPFRGRYPSGLNGFVAPHAKQVVIDIDQVLSLAEGAVKAAPWRKPGA